MGKWGGILPTSRLLLLAVVAAATCIGAPVRAEKRVALVIGNDRYANLPAERQLQKAVNDAEAVGDTLARLGFEVIRGRNLGRQGIIDKLELTAKLAPGDTAAFFYAGHGVAIGGVNYLVPSDAPLVTPDAEARVRGASVSEPDLIAEIQSKSPRVAFLAIDACRDNPFPRSGGRSIGQTAAWPKPSRCGASSPCIRPASARRRSIASNPTTPIAIRCSRGSSSSSWPDRASISAVLQSRCANAWQNWH